MKLLLQTATRIITVLMGTGYLLQLYMSPRKLQQLKDEMPLNMVQQLIGDCAGVDLSNIRNDQLQARKTAKQQ